MPSEGALQDPLPFEQGPPYLDAVRVFGPNFTCFTYFCIFSFLSIMLGFCSWFRLGFFSYVTQEFELELN